MELYGKNPFFMSVVALFGTRRLVRGDGRQAFARLIFLTQLKNGDVEKTHHYEIRYDHHLGMYAPSAHALEHEDIPGYLCAVISDEEETVEGKAEFWQALTRLAEPVGTVYEFIDLMSSYAQFAKIWRYVGQKLLGELKKGRMAQILLNQRMDEPELLQWLANSYNGIIDLLPSFQAE